MGDFSVSDHRLVPLAVLSARKESKETETQPVGIQIRKSGSIRRRGNDNIHLPPTLALLSQPPAVAFADIKPAECSASVLPQESQKQPDGAADFLKKFLHGVDFISRFDLFPNPQIVLFLPGNPAKNIAQRKQEKVPN